MGVNLQLPEQYDWTIFVVQSAWRDNMFDKDKHYQSHNIRWNEYRVRNTIQSIVDDAVNSFNPNSNWHCHPMDDFCGSDLYMGSTGVFWAINYLEKVGAIETDFHIDMFLDAELESVRESFKESPHNKNSSYLFGDLPVLMLMHSMRKQNSLEDAIYDSITVNNFEPVRELMWGTAGTMIAADFMAQSSEDKKWSEVFLLQAKRLLDDWQRVSGIGYLWSPELYGDTRKYLGPVHGFSGNLVPLIKGQRHLSESLYDGICIKAMEAVVNLASVDGQYANWSSDYKEGTDSKLNLVQHCHGAPGMITALSKLPVNKNTEFDRLLAKGGELVWLAGPLKKGSNLCHGTSGNGYAFLKLFERSQHELWLDRARIFAMDAIEQYEVSKKFYKQGRFSLWTGDVGLAVYLWDCLNAQAKFPTIDVF